MKFADKYIIYFAILTTFLGCVVHAKYMEQVDDTDLIHLLTAGEDNVIVLFTKTNCPECDKLEKVVVNIEDDLKTSLGAVVVKSHDSHLINIYDPSKEPSLVYFRQGIPLLYHGEYDGHEILQTFSENKDPVVKELSDENFEHLTQAATGATTGDWFAFFYSADCVLCQRLYAVWEAVGSKLRRRLNVIRINRLEAGITTARRFGVTQSPTFIFLRQGKFYRYNSNDYTPKDFIEFAEGGYLRNSRPEPVPQTPNVMNDYIEHKLKILSELPMWLISGVGLLFLFVVGKIVRSLTKPKPQPPTAQKTVKTKKAN